MAVLGCNGLRCVINMILSYSLSLSMKKKMGMILKALLEWVLAWELWLVPGINTSSVPICSHSSSGFQCNLGMMVKDLLE